MLVFAIKAGVSGEGGNTTPRQKLGERLPESPVPTCSSKNGQFCFVN